MNLEPLSPLASLKEALDDFHDELAAVCLSNVSVHRGSEEVLYDIDLCVDTGVFLGIIGPNGGGKTTLLKTIIGSIVPTTGTVNVFGEKPSLRNRRKNCIGYVPQNQVIPENFPATVYDTVMMGAYAANSRFLPIKHEYKVRAKHLLEEVRMDHLVHQPIGKLSGGQQQRVMIARALVTNPKLLLLDEPLRGIDASGQEQFVNLLLELKQQYDLTVIMVSHHISHLAKFADRIACLNRTIHWHDHSELINHQVLHHVYKCELEAVFNQEDFLVGELEENPFKPSDPAVHKHLVE